MGFDKYGSGETFESCDKFGSGGAVYGGEPIETIPPEQQLQNVINAIVPVAQSIIEALMPTIESCMVEIKRFCDAVLNLYPNNRVVWLALHHKQERVRKKNRRRILKWIERTGKHGGSKKM